MESATEKFVTRVNGGVAPQHALALLGHHTYGFRVQPESLAPVLAGSAPTPATLSAPAATINPSTRCRVHRRGVRAGPFLMLFIEPLPGLTPPDAMPYSDIADGRARGPSSQRHKAGGGHTELMHLLGGSDVSVQGKSCMDLGEAGFVVPVLLGLEGRQGGQSRSVRCGGHCRVRPRADHRRDHRQGD